MTGQPANDWFGGKVAGSGNGHWLREDILPSTKSGRLLSGPGGVGIHQLEWVSFEILHQTSFPNCDSDSGRGGLGEKIIRTPLPGGWLPKRRFVGPAKILQKIQIILQLFKN